ncbi:hypothetical protein A2U01_0079957, partial [Trifolium medium]|nr:hypothetical protein [Trifolium medium]
DDDCSCLYIGVPADNRASRPSAK